MVSGLEAKRSTEGPSRVGKGKEKELDMHGSPTNLVMKKDTGDAYESPAYGGRSRTKSVVSGFEAKRPTSALVPAPHQIHTSDNKNVARGKVRETLRLFQVIFRILSRDQEAKPKEERKRVDGLANSILKKNYKYVNPGKAILGHVPGVEVGDEFRYRFELAIVGLHRPSESGIDFLREDEGHLIKLATSIVAYAELDNMDKLDVLIYTGHGGLPGRGKKQAEDQKLTMGNLALKNSRDEKEPVRVIRKFQDKTVSNTIISRYIYDGFYLVEYYWVEKGPHGKNVFKFELRRIPGQPELGFKEAQKLKTSRIGLCEVDISRGRERIPVSAVNMVDNEKPPLFEYITNVKFPSPYIPTPPKGCQCKDKCSDSKKCSCVVRNGGKMPFNLNGEIVCAEPLVYKCGPLCKCPPSCYNRVSQHGIRFELQIFKTESRGWGVRSLSFIPSGSFICEYTGELLDDNEAEKRIGKHDYLFDIGNNYNDGNLWNDLSHLISPELQSRLCSVTVENVGFTIDALKYGNVGRFINHSCSPNVFAQNVLYDYDDKRMPHIMFFAAENIPPLRELTYHYNDKLDQVRDSDGKIKKKKCYCGSHNCSGRLY